MLSTLHGRLTLVLLSLLLPIGVLFVLGTLFTSRQYYQEVTQQINASLAENILLETNLMLENEVDVGKLDALAHQLAMTNPGVEIYILNNTGEIIGSSVEMGQLLRKQIDLEPLNAFHTEAAVLPILGTDPRSKTGKKIFSAAPLADNKGYLYVLLADQLRDSVIRTVRNSTALRLGFWSGAAVVILVFSLGVLMFNLLTRRLRQLESAMTSFRQHDFVLAAPPMPEQNRFRDEIDKLQGIFGEMSQRISEQVQGLRQVDTLRRELITNVSHDLRTPLAALQAYLETLQLKDTSLSLEQKRAYLSAAQKHSERLGKLIGDLFDLSRLEADAVEAQLEAFPIQELAQDVLLKFDGLAAERQIKLGLQLDEALPFIRADIGLIERVLTNLIDNALRYTPAGGSVTIRLRRQGKAVEVAVQDTGKGIAEKDIPHVFDRFYRADKYEAEGTGLGLAITKRILELHGQAILIESALGKGSTFSFKLLTQS